VKRGEHGVKVVTFIESKSREIDQDTGEAKRIRRPWTTTDKANTFIHNRTLLPRHHSLP
jgi:hypothetical protein